MIAVGEVMILVNVLNFPDGQSYDFPRNFVRLKPFSRFTDSETKLIGS